MFARSTKSEEDAPDGGYDTDLDLGLLNCHVCGLKCGAKELKILHVRCCCQLHELRYPRQPLPSNLEAAAIRAVKAIVAYARHIARESEGQLGLTLAGKAEGAGHDDDLEAQSEQHSQGHCGPSAARHSVDPFNATSTSRHEWGTVRIRFYDKWSSFDCPRHR
jgi:hypothetical protein